MLDSPASRPKKELSAPVVFARPAECPKKEFEVPLVFAKPAERPKKEFVPGQSDSHCATSNDVLNIVRSKKSTTTLRVCVVIRTMGPCSLVDNIILYLAFEIISKAHSRQKISPLSQ